MLQCPSSDLIQIFPITPGLGLDTACIQSAEEIEYIAVFVQRYKTLLDEEYISGSGRAKISGKASHVRISLLIAVV
jgi:hypothetical protein